MCLSQIIAMALHNFPKHAAIVWLFYLMHPLSNMLRTYLKIAVIEFKLIKLHFGLGLPQPLPVVPFSVGSVRWADVQATLQRQNKNSSFSVLSH